MSDDDPAGDFEECWVAEDRSFIWANGVRYVPAPEKLEHEDEPSKVGLTYTMTDEAWAQYGWMSGAMRRLTELGLVQQIEHKPRRDTYSFSPASKFYKAAADGV